MGCWLARARGDGVGERRAVRITAAEFYVFFIPSASFRRSRERLRRILVPRDVFFAVFLPDASTESVSSEASIARSLVGERGGSGAGDFSVGPARFQVVSVSHFAFVCSHLARRSSMLERRLPGPSKLSRREPSDSFAQSLPL